MNTTNDSMARAARASARQRIEFRTGDEAAAMAARAAGSLPGATFTQVAFAYGAALGGERVLSTTRSQGLIAAVEQLAVQAAGRIPMVLSVALGDDHSSLYQALNAGCIVLCARDPQAVYDFNLAAVRIGEHADVRLPVLVAYDGRITSEEKRRVLVLDDATALESFLGPRAAVATPLDVAQPATYGAPMEANAFLDNRAQLAQAMDAARRVIPAVFAELAAVTGRSYPVLDAYAMDDAEAAVVLLNTAAEAAKEAVDVWRDDKRRVGVLSPNVLRPFPADEFRALLGHVKAATVGDRADSYGAMGGNLSMEVRAAIQQDRSSETLIVSRIYGLGGKAFHATDAEQFLDLAFQAASARGVHEPFAYHGATLDKPPRPAPKGLPPIRAEEASRGMAKVRHNEASGRLEVELQPLWKMTAVPNRLAPGHGACPGCGVFPLLHQVYKVLEGNVVVLFQSGCAIEVTTAHAATAQRINCVHNAAGNGAATLSGLVEAYRGKDITFVMITGDGGMEADIAGALDAAHRNARIMILEYDNQGRMSAGGEPSHSSALGRRICRSEIFAACHLPYVFTASEGYPEDLMRKVAKAQWYARNEGMIYGSILSFCPLNWRTPDDAAQPVLQAAIDSCFFPLYEVERGHTTITYDPDAASRRRPVAEWLKLMGKTAHLLDPANAAIVAEIQAETDRRWARLRAMHEHPLL